MRILAIDTGADICAAILLENGNVKAFSSVNTERDQAKMLAPLVQTLLAEHNTPLASIDRFAVATGPGSFTGLRVGLAFIRGLGLACGKATYGYSHFHLMAHALCHVGLKQALLIRESKREELYAAWMKDGTAQEPFGLATSAQCAAWLEENKNAAFCGDGAHHVLNAHPEYSKRHIILPHEVLMHSLAVLCQNDTAPAQAPTPVYLREADVTFPTAAHKERAVVG